MLVPISSPVTLLAQFGVSYTGLSTVGYTLKNFDGSTTYPGRARSTAGVRDLGTGDYAVLYTFSALWTGYIEWDSGGVSPVYAREELDVVPVGTPGIGVIATASAAESDRVTLGPENVPQDVRKLRRHIHDYFNKLGQPVIFKHKWTNDDVAAGLAQYCPYCFNKAWKQPSQVDPYCFGTGFLGGFAQGVIVFVTLGDTSKDVFKLTEEGVLTKDNHPTCSAPWLPDFQDEDLLIAGTFDPNLWDVTGLSDRYIIQEVNAINPRGSIMPNGRRVILDNNKWQVSQQFQIDSIQEQHPYWRVPVIFDYSTIPAYPAVPPGGNPADYGGTTRVSTSIRVRMPVAVQPGRVTVSFPVEV